jgi:hypothetical protein
MRSGLQLRPVRNKLLVSMQRLNNWMTAITDLDAWIGTCDMSSHGALTTPTEGRTTIPIAFGHGCKGIQAVKGRQVLHRSSSE